MIHKILSVVLCGLLSLLAAYFIHLWSQIKWTLLWDLLATFLLNPFNIGHN